MSRNSRLLLATCLIASAGLLGWQRYQIMRLRSLWEQFEQDEAHVNPMDLPSYSVIDRTKPASKSDYVFAAARRSLRRITQQIGDPDRDPVALFKALPRFLDSVQGLDTEALIRLAQDLPDDEMGKAAEAILYELIAEQDPKRALELESTQMVEGLYPTALRELATREPANVLSYFQQLPIGNRQSDRVRAEVALALLKTELDQALTFLRETGEGDWGKYTRRAIIWALKHAGLRESMIRALPSEEDAGQRRQLSELIAKSIHASEGLDAARAWLDSQNVSVEDGFFEE